MLQVRNEDCLTGMRGLALGSIDVVVTSPPYNLGIDYASYDDGGARADYLAWCSEWALEVKRLLAPGGSFFLNLGSKPTDPWVSHDVLSVMRRYFRLQNRIHWVKSYSPAPGEPCRGHVKQLNSERFLNDAHEFVYHLTLSGKVKLDRRAVGVPYADKSNLKRGTRGQHGDRRCAGNVWVIPYKTIQRRASDRPHPATFPVELPRRCLQLHGLDRIGCVLDPFLGLGTTLVACQQLGVNGIGFELDPEYAVYAQERLEKASAR